MGQIYGEYAIGKNNLNYLCYKYNYIMVNLEWYRTFKSVYKNRNFSLAAKELYISQPAVSQQIAMLEAHVGYQLFNRKSKGVEPTDYAKLLNNLIIEALDRLESVENGFREKAFQTNKLISIGISKHNFSSIGNQFVKVFDFVDFSFAENEALFQLVDNKKIDLAVVSKKIDTFDTVQQSIGFGRLILVASMDIEANNLKLAIEKDDNNAIEKWLNKQKWYDYDAQIPNVKQFWLYVLNKKRPTLMANYIIPNETEMMKTLSENSGVAIVWDYNAKPFIENQQLQLLWQTNKMPTQELFLMVRKNNHYDDILNQLKQITINNE
ncbi:MAG: LysR family transcriptional regulator [Sphingobacteriaceae bacterium]|nr:LysR family transcriptional regulator [Sphingobacteriaceae bacterium]